MLYLKGSEVRLGTEPLPTSFYKMFFDTNLKHNI